MNGRNDIILVSLDSGFYQKQRAANVGLASLDSYLKHQGFSAKVIQGNEVGEYVNTSDVFGLSVLDHTYQAAQKLTRELKGKKIIWGGQTPTAMPEAIFAENPGIDYIIHQEGEKRLCNLLRSFTERDVFETIDGITFRDVNDHIITRPPTEFMNMDELPVPGSRATQDRLVYIEFTRGCYGRCRYCQETGHMRFKSTEKTLSEIRHWYEAGYRCFYIGNANSISNGSRLASLVRGIEKMDLPVSIILVGRPDDVVRNSDILESVFYSKSIHLQGIEIGIETNAMHSLHLLGRTTTPEINKEAVELLIRLKDRYSPDTIIYANMILFSHFDMTVDDFIANIRFIGDYDCSRDVMVLKLIGLANTPIWKDMKEKGFRELRPFGSRITDYHFTDYAVDRLYRKLVHEPLERLSREKGLYSDGYRMFRDRCYDQLIGFYNSSDIGASLMRFIDS